MAKFSREFLKPNFMFQLLGSVRWGQGPGVKSRGNFCGGLGHTQALSTFSILIRCDCLHLYLSLSIKFLCSLPRADELTKKKRRVGEGIQNFIFQKTRKTLLTNPLPEIQGRVPRVRKTYRIVGP